MNRLAAFALVCSACAPAQEPPELRDPAPPTAQSLDGAPVLEPKTNPRAKFHATPRALVEGAIVEDAPGFLGARREPISRERPLRKDFEKGALPLVWELEAGSGYAAPAILGERMLFVHRRENEEIVECLHPADGRLYWSYAYPSAYEDPFGFGDGPKCTPLLEGDFAWTFGVEGKLHCFHLPSGRVVWRRDLMHEFELAPSFFGVGSTPLLEGDDLIVNLGAPKGPCIAAFDKRTGRLRWGAGEAWGPSYAAPIAAEVHGKRLLFVFAGGQSRPPDGGLLGIDLATRKQVFAFPWRSRTYYSVNAATPIVRGERVFVTEAYGRGGVQLRLDANGTATEVWTNAGFGLHWATPLLRGELLLGCAGEKLPDSELVCVEWTSGKERWRQRIEWEEPPASTGGTRALGCTIGRATLIEADGDVLCLAEDGHLLWLRCDERGATVLARAWPFYSRESWIPPVLSRGLLYLRQGTQDLRSTAGPRLLCFDLRGELR